MQLTLDIFCSVTFTLVSAELVCCYFVQCQKLLLQIFSIISSSLFLLTCAQFDTSKWRIICNRLAPLRVQANHKLLLSFSVHVKIHYKEDLGGGTALPETPEMERVKRNQHNISMVLHRVTLPSLISSILPSMCRLNLVSEIRIWSVSTCNPHKWPFSTIYWYFFSFLLLYILV